jgi:hypothetical protein
VPRPTFKDFRKAGLEINLITAIDFSATNKEFHRSQDSGYESCLRQVTEIVCPYDSDQKFPVAGFAVEIDGQYREVFSLTLDERNPIADGKEGIIESYRKVVELTDSKPHKPARITMSGPTRLAPVVNWAKKWVDLDGADYTILLVITDGQIDDMEATIRVIADCVELPISMIFVGISRGNNRDFAKLERLDGDEKKLLPNGRDLIQFVPYEKVTREHVSALIIEVLAEVPDQVIEWAKRKNITPEFIHAKRKK